MFFEFITELIGHYFSIIVFGDFLGGRLIMEDDPVLDLAYMVAGL